MTDMALSTLALSAGYEPRANVIHDIGISLARGEIVCVVGTNGAGKSTLLKALMGALPRRQGVVMLEGSNISALPPSTIVARGMGYVPQRDNVFEGLTVEENLGIGLRVRPEMSPSRRIEAMYMLFPALRERRRQPAGSLSGGERQMLAIARALMPKPSVLLLDEPTTGLAPAMVEVLFGLLAEICASGVSILMVEQKAARALACSHRGYVLHQGRIIHEGPGPALADDPRLADMYLGAGAQPA